MNISSNFDSFYKDLKATEKADSVLTPKQQIERLLRPGKTIIDSFWSHSLIQMIFSGSTYRNLNPYEVLQIDPETPIEDIRKKYRRLSILVHPDKNQDDSERAQAAFDALKKAYALLDDEKTRKKCEEIVEEAKGRTLQNMEEKRKKLIKENKGKGITNHTIDEDDPAKFKQSVHILTMKLFADLERKRRQLEQRASDEAARKREAELEAEERKNIEKEFAKNWEESRQGRVNSWLNFTSGGSKAGPSVDPPPAPMPVQQQQQPKINHNPVQVSLEKKKKKKEKRFSPMGFRPPKHKPESR